jgi:DNA-binding response OmpR family regulator
MDALIAEDHDVLANALLWALQRILPGWDIQRVEDGRSAEYALIMDSGVRLAVLDYLLPRADAEKVVASVLQIRPKLKGKIIICSGIDYPDDVAERLFVDLGCKRLDKGNHELLFELERLVLQIVNEPA